jgi:hypothetical protein
LSLYGIDDGYPEGMWGPQFIDPYLTLNYTSIEYITNEIYNVIESVIDDEQTDLIVDIITQDTETNEWVLVDTISEEEEAAALLAEQEAARLEEERLAQEEADRIAEEERVAEEARIAAELLAEQEAEEEREATVVTIAASETEIQFEDTSEDMFNEPLEVAFTAGPEGPIDFADTTDTFSSAVLETAVDIPPPEVDFAGFEEPALEPPLEMAVEATEMPSIESIEAEIEPDIEVVEEPSTEAPVASETVEESTPELVVESTTEEEPKATETAPKESKKERVARKVADRVMTTLAQTYNITMQNVALSVMGRQTDITSYNQQMLDASSWYPDMQLEGGTNYDHPSQIYIQAAANQDMAELEAIQWR